MHPNTLLLSLLSLSTLGSTVPAPQPENSNSNPQENTSITASQIEHIAPKSSSCANPPAKGECATSDTAARNIAASFDQYEVTSRAEQAAVIALMAFESDEFQFSRNHVPGVEGQGTRNMQSPSYNLKYAKSLDKIRDKVAEAKSDKAQILDLLLADKEYDFGSGAWFLTTQCQNGVREKLRSGSDEGWEGYVKNCVGTDANEGRKGYWKKAVEALGL